MTNATKKKRMWAGYTCPVCRFVFRVPKEHDGAGVICPACHHLLKLPELSGDAQSVEQDQHVAPPIIPAPRENQENKPIVSRPLKSSDTMSADATRHLTQVAVANHKRRKKSGSSAEPSWDRQTASTGSLEGNPMLWVILASVIGLTVVAIGVWLAWDNINAKDQPRTPGSGAALAGSAKVNPSDGSVKLASKELKEKPETSQSVETGKNILEDSEKVIRAFLTSEKSSDLESLVRTPDETIPRMRQWYTQHEWSPPGLKKAGHGGGLTINGEMASMRVKLEDYSVKHIAVERTPQGYLVDWESWVGWSEMDWKDLFKKRPSQAVEVRVICVLDNYYNREFRDEKKWQSVRLEYPDADRSIYAYIDRKATNLTSLMGDLNGRRSLPATLKIRYAKDAQADNQVIIDEYIQNGWVRPSVETP